MVVIVVEDALEILKSYRQQHLYATLGLLRIPLLSKDMEQRFSCQFLCRCSSSQLFFSFFRRLKLTSQDLFTNKRLVVFVHEL